MAEDTATALVRQSKDAWTGAREYARRLAGGESPAPLGVTGLVLQPGEQASIHTAAAYSRFYGENGTYTPVGGFVLGAPALVAASIVGTAAFNAHRRSQARSRAVPQWRDAQEVAVLATSQRLACQTSTAGWLSFWLSSVHEFYPAPQEWALTLVWADAAPLRLAGLAAPALCVHVARVLMPDQWTSHPALAPLLT